LTYINKFDIIFNKTLTETLIMESIDNTIKSLSYSPPYTTVGGEMSQTLYISQEKKTPEEITEIVKNRFANQPPTIGAYRFENENLSYWYAQGSASNKSVHNFKYQFEGKEQYRDLIMKMKSTGYRTLKLYDDMTKKAYLLHPDKDIQVYVDAIEKEKQPSVTPQGELLVTPVTSPSRSKLQKACMGGCLLAAIALITLYIARNRGALLPSTLSTQAILPNVLRFQYYPSEPLLEALKKALN
jgi:hypothetical protein